MSTSEKRCRRAKGECPCRGSSLDRLLQPRILSVLAGGPLHGYRIAGELAAPGGGSRPDPTGLYRALKALERRGLLEATWMPSRSGPDRRLFRLTPGGRRCLAAWMRTLADYRKEIGTILRAGRRPSRQRRGGRPGSGREAREMSRK